MSSTLFNYSELLENLNGDEEFVSSILGEALVEIPKDVEQLKELCNGEDAKSISICAHTTKGMAANLCFPALRDILFKIEVSAREGELETARSYLPEMEQVVRMTLEAIIH